MAHWLEEVGSRASGFGGPEVLGADVNLLVGRLGPGAAGSQERPMAAGLLVGRALSPNLLLDCLYQHQCPHGKILMLVVSNSL